MPADLLNKKVCSLLPVGDDLNWSICLSLYQGIRVSPFAAEGKIRCSVRLVFPILIAQRPSLRRCVTVYSAALSTIAKPETVRSSSSIPAVKGATESPYVVYGASNNAA